MRKDRVDVQDLLNYREHVSKVFDYIGKIIEEIAKIDDDDVRTSVYSSAIITLLHYSNAVRVDAGCLTGHIILFIAGVFGKAFRHMLEADSMEFAMVRDLFGGE